MTLPQFITRQLPDMIPDATLTFKDVTLYADANEGAIQNLPPDVFEELTKDLEDDRLRYNFFVAIIVRDITPCIHTMTYSSTPVHTDGIEPFKEVQYAVWVNYDIRKVTEETMSSVSMKLIRCTMTVINCKETTVMIQMRLSETWSL